MIVIITINIQITTSASIIGKFPMNLKTIFNNIIVTALINYKNKYNYNNNLAQIINELRQT